MSLRGAQTDKELAEIKQLIRDHPTKTSDNIKGLHQRIENHFVTKETHDQAHETRKAETSSLRRVIYAIGTAGIGQSVGLQPGFGASVDKISTRDS